MESRAYTGSIGSESNCGTSNKDGKSQCVTSSLRSTFALVAVLLTVGAALSIPVASGFASTLGSPRPVVHPVSISFLTARHGFVLSVNDCATRTCVSLAKTDDAGATWTSLSLPSQLSREIRTISWYAYPNYFVSESLMVHFADPRDGWIYGVIPAPATATQPSPNFADRLWSTHNGGESWTALSLSGLGIDSGVAQMATHGALTYLFGSSYVTSHSRILSTPNARDRWTSASPPMGIPAGGSQLQGAFTFAGKRGWFVSGNDRGIQSLEQLTPSGTWTTWRVRSLALGEGFTPVIAESSRDLVVVTSDAGWYFPPPANAPLGWSKGATWLFLSRDGGKTFNAVHELAKSSATGFPSENGLPAAPTPGTIFVERESGTSTTTFQLLMSKDAGRTWRVVINQRVLQVAFATASVGYAIVVPNSDPRRASLCKTTDGGMRWSSQAV